MRVNVRCVWVAFVCCCIACDCVIELVVCLVRFARVSCPWLKSQAVCSRLFSQPIHTIRRLFRRAMERLGNSLSETNLSSQLDQEALHACP